VVREEKKKGDERKGGRRKTWRKWDRPCRQIKRKYVKNPQSREKKVQQKDAT